MTDIQLHHNETLFSMSFLTRLQVPTERSLDTCCTALIELFVERYKDDIDKLLQLGNEKLDEVDKYLTVVVDMEDLGVKSGKNPSRAIKLLQENLNIITSTTPYIIYEILSGGKKVYQSLPLIKYSKVEDNGKCTIIFNDQLRFHISPKKKYGKCCVDSLRDIKNLNIYAGIIYEEACAYQNYYNHGMNPFFDWSEQHLREKFSFDQMIGVTGKVKTEEYDVVRIKTMRIDFIRKKILPKALDVLEKFFKNGKIPFWVKMTTSDTGKKKVGRPQKRNFRFEIIKTTVVLTDAAVQQEIPFDEYEEITNHTEMKKEMTLLGFPKEFTDKVLIDTENLEAEGVISSENVISKIRYVKSKYAAKGKKQCRNILRKILWDDFNIGEEVKKCDESEHYLLPWPDNINDKIRAMQESYEICDRAIREHPELSLTSEKVINILGHEFRDYCINSNHPKPLRDWKDATELFYTLLKKSWFVNKLNYENGDNQIYEQCQSDYSEEAMLRFYGGGECNGNV